MNHQPRQPAGSRHSGRSTAGQFATKTVPTAINNPAEFRLDACTARTVSFLGTSTTFTRRVNDDSTVTVTTDCDPPEMLLLARKADTEYWSGDNWTEDHQAQQLWCSAIAAQMIEEGLVCVANSDGIAAAMAAASSPLPRKPSGSMFAKADNPHTFTEIVAQIRGLRLICSTASSDAFNTVLGGHSIPVGSWRMLTKCFEDTFDAWKLLNPPPLNTNENTQGDDHLFVGEHSDLVWRALTETNHTGLSPLKTTLRERFGIEEDTRKTFVAEAALYDEQAEQQLTTGLFDGFDEKYRFRLRNNALDVFNHVLNDPPGQQHLSVDQTKRIRSFVETIETLKM